MATILSLKRRIKAAQNVSKTTRAMQMISASKLKKAQQSAVSTRPYVKELETMTFNVAGKIDPSTFSHPYVMNKNAEDRNLLIVIAPDKGLCGGLLSNLVKKYLEYIKQDKDSYQIVIGKKIEGTVGRLHKDVIASFRFGTVTPTFDAVFPIMKIIDEYYLGGKVNKVKILYTEFTDFFNQTPLVKTLLPIKLTFKQDEEPKQNLTYVFEPKPADLLPALIRHDIEMSLYHMLLESFASEQASRMVTMQNATTNANDIIEDLNLEYNKTRQAKITSELLDITGSGIAAA